MFWEDGSYVEVTAALPGMVIRPPRLRRILGGFGGLSA
jgi:hypothetical protein